MKKRSLITAFLAFSVLANAIWMAFHLVKVAVEFTDDAYRMEQRALASDFVNIRSDLKSANFADLTHELQQLKQYGHIDFAYLSDDGGSPFSITNEKLKSDFQYAIDGSVKILEVSGKPEGAYIGEVWGKRTIILGKIIDLAKVQGPFLRASRGNLLWLLAGNVLIILFLAFYYLQDFFKLARAARWGGLAAAAAALRGSKFKETQAMGMLFSQAQQKTKDALDSLKEAQQQILPSFLSEMNEGKKLPYDFDAYLVRVDINGSTSAFSNDKLKSVIDHWFNQFFFLSNEVVNRYGGYFHEVIGDEILFYLKCDPENPNQAGQLALSCVRDIFALTDEIDHQIDPNLKFHFKVKAAIDLGKLKVAQGFRGLRILGLPPRNILVSTTRMLDLVTDKSINSCVVPSNLFSDCGHLLESPFPISEKISGFAQNINFSLVTKFQPLQLEIAPPNLFFRSDKDLEKICEHLAIVDSETYVLGWVSVLAKVRNLKTDQRLPEQVVKTLEAFAQKQWWRAVASFTMLLPKLIPNHQVPERLDRVLVNLMVGPDSRVQANAIETWNLLGLDMRVIERNSAHWQQPRSLANAIVAVLLQTLDLKYLKLLKKMLGSGSTSMQASACYALEVTILHYAKVDAMILETNSDIQQLVKMGLALKASSDSIVANRAVILEKLLAEIRPRYQQAS